jgi:phosphate transport system substrate-binding protein
LAGTRHKPGSEWPFGFVAIDAKLVNMAGEGSYPIVAAVFGLASDRSSQRAKTARAFLNWSVTSGRATAEKLGYVALPPSTVQKVQAVLR